jgi:hypothetical protein
LEAHLSSPFAGPLLLIYSNKITISIDLLVLSLPFSVYVLHPEAIKLILILTPPITPLITWSQFLPWFLQLLLHLQLLLLLMLSLSSEILLEHILEVGTAYCTTAILDFDVAGMLMKFVMRGLLELGFQLWQIH